MKKSIYLNLFALFCCLWTTHLSAANEFRIDQLIYTPLTGNTVSVKAANPRAITENISIPSQVENNGITYRVTHIADKGFQGSGKMVSIDLPGNLTVIGAWAFSGCENLSTISVPEGVTTIKAGAFHNCFCLESVGLPNSLTELGDSAFYQTSRLTFIRIPESVSQINRHTFEYSGLTSINLPQQLKSIGEKAFMRCTELNSIVIPESVKAIGLGAFVFCKKLTTVTLPKQLSTIENDLFFGCGNLASITLPQNITSIGESAFTGCTSLTSIQIPDKVETINVYAFKNCYNLTSVQLPNNLEFISPHTFEDCWALTSITLPEALEGIYDNAFYGCTSLASIRFPDQLILIGSKAFTGCPITSISFPDHLTDIGWGAFAGCPITSLTLPQALKYLGGGAFAGCQNLTSVSLSSSLAEIGKEVFMRCSSLASVTLPDCLTAVSDSMFAHCAKLTAINLPKSVAHIGNGAFAFCPALSAPALDADNPYLESNADGKLLYTQGKDTLVYVSAQFDGELTLPDHTQCIQNGALSGAKGLTAITLGSQLQEANLSKLFDDEMPETYRPNRLKRIVCKSQLPPSFGECRFAYPEEQLATIELVVPDLAESKYASDRYWSNFHNRTTWEMSSELVARADYLHNHKSTKIWYANDTTQLPDTLPTSAAWADLQLRHEKYFHTPVTHDSTTLYNAMIAMWKIYYADRKGNVNTEQSHTVKCADGNLLLLDRIDDDIVDWLLNPYLVTDIVIENHNKTQSRIVTCDPSLNIPGNQYTVLEGKTTTTNPQGYAFAPMAANFAYRISCIMAPDTETTDEQPLKNRLELTANQFDRLDSTGRPRFSTHRSAIMDHIPQQCDTLLCDTVVNIGFAKDNTAGNLMIQSRATMSHIKRGGYTHTLRVVGFLVEPLYPVDPPTAIDEVKDSTETNGPHIKEAYRNKLFDLGGREVTGTPKPGLYIRNGHKVLIR